MNSDHKLKTRSAWPSLLGLYVIIENAYIVVLPADRQSLWAACIGPILVTANADRAHTNDLKTNKKNKFPWRYGAKIPGRKRPSNATAPPATVQGHDFKFRVRNMNVQWGRSGVCHPWWLRYIAYIVHSQRYRVLESSAPQPWQNCHHVVALEISSWEGHHTRHSGAAVVNDDCEHSPWPWGDARQSADCVGTSRRCVSISI